MKPIRIIITGAGAPGIQGTIHSLRQNYDQRDVYIIGTDISQEVVGTFICDEFYTIPRASKKAEYLAALLKLASETHADILLPQNTAELLTLAQNKSKFEEIGVKVVVSNAESIEISNNKFNLMELCRKHDVPVGDYYLVNTSAGLQDAAKKLGWPEVPVIVKPPESNGQRGIRIIDEKFDPKEMFYNEKPNSLYTNMHELCRILGDNFPELIVTEFLPGVEYTVDLFRSSGRIDIIPRCRTLIRSGITFNATLEQHADIIRYSKILTEVTNLEHCFGFQFKLDRNGVPKILESNPRVQGTMVISTFAGANCIYSAVKNVLGEEIPEFNIDWNTKLYRYWGGVVSAHNQVVHI
jgi:carbamoyl-phosphate synthase large subunit